MPTRWAMPPESSCGNSACAPASCTTSSAWPMRCAFYARFMPLRWASASPRFSPTVSQRNRRGA